MSTAKIVYLTLAVLIAASLINFIRGGNAFHIARILPFCSGGPPGLYDWAGVAMFVITAWGVQRLRNGNDSDD